MNYSIFLTQYYSTLKRFGVIQRFRVRISETKYKYLRCLRLYPGRRMHRFSFRRDTTKWQFRISAKGEIPRKRIAAIRVPFLKNIMNGKVGLTASHLCHNQHCLNPRHIVLESLAKNKGRNGCAGPGSCDHKPRCIIPGPGIWDQEGYEAEDIPDFFPKDD